MTHFYFTRQNSTYILEYYRNSMFRANVCRFGWNSCFGERFHGVKTGLKNKRPTPAEVSWLTWEIPCISAKLDNKIFAESILLKSTILFALFFILSRQCEVAVDVQTLNWGQRQHIEGRYKSPKVLLLRISSMYWA